MHRDLKAENVLITVEDQGNLRIKLSDFGESRDMADTAEYITQVGTEYYMAPEVGSGQYQKAADVFSLGCLMFYMLEGKLPWGQREDYQLCEMTNPKSDFFAKGI